MCIRLESRHSSLYILLGIAVLAASFVITLQDERVNPVSYLTRFGYLPAQTTNPYYRYQISQNAMTVAIKEFQAFVGLIVTGYLDKETVEKMKLPRCGVKDKVGFGTDSRSERYLLPNSRWGTKNLTYKISKYSRNLPTYVVDMEISRAFDVWSRVTPLTFTEVKSGPVAIEIRFEIGEHGDGDPFDGRGETLAHATYPINGGGYVHFDDAERWTVNSYSGTNLFQVAAHEFGHSLGLMHSNNPGALMGQNYRGYDPTFELADDDVNAIQALYGLPEKTNQGGSKPAPREAPGEEEVPEICNDATIDTIFYSAGVIYAFKGLHYWKLTEDSIASGYPQLISKSWSGLPGNIDAAFTYMNGKTFFFKGSQYWRYTGKKMDGGFPKQISLDFPGIPNNIDAAMVWGGNGNIYFYKGSKFWRYDPTRPPWMNAYPMDMPNWEGVPKDLDAALHYTDGYTYFFKKGSYYKFNDPEFAFHVADRPIPKPAGHWWFGCRSETKGGITGEYQNNNHDVVGGGRRLWPQGRRRSDDLSDDDVTDLIMDGERPEWPGTEWNPDTDDDDTDYDDTDYGDTDYDFTDYDDTDYDDTDYDDTDYDFTDYDDTDYDDTDYDFTDYDDTDYGDTDVGIDDQDVTKSRDLFGNLFSICLRRS